MLIDEIIRLLNSDQGGITEALLKTKILLHQIGHRELVEWVNDELNGYEDGKEVPPSGSLGTFWFLTSASAPGFRSSLRNWAEQTSFPHEVCEMARAYAVENRVEAAYRRSDLFEKRHELIDAGASFIVTEA